MFEGSEETFIILQNTLLDSVTNVSFDYQVNEEAILLLSNRGINRKINKPQTAKCSISKAYTNRDFLQELTGVTNLSGQFIFGDKALDFNEAVITKYSVSVNAKKIPKISVDLQIYGDLKPTATIRKDDASGDYAIKDLDVGAISLSMDDTNSAVTDFVYDVQFDVRPTYEIESIKSSSAKIITPIKYGCAANLEIIEQEFENMTGLVNTESFNRNISFSFTDKDLNVLNSYSVPNASLSSQNISIKPRDTIQLALKYNGYSLLADSAPAAPKFPTLQTIDPVSLQTEDFNSRATGIFDLGYFHFLPGSFTDTENFNSYATGLSGPATGNMHSFIEATVFHTEDFNSESTGNFGIADDIGDKFLDFQDFNSQDEGTTGLFSLT